MANPDRGLIDAILANPLSVIGTLIAGIGLLLTWRKIREDSLRRGEVLDWANESIEALEGLVMVCILEPYPAFSDECRTRLARIAFDSAILVERGRMFFKNQPRGSFGTDKKSAYRGFRPRILDPLIAAHQVAVRWPTADSKARIAMQCVAEDHLRDFVSLIQKEVGRERTASLVTKQGGQAFNLNSAIRAIEPGRLAHVERRATAGQERYREFLAGAREPR